MTEVEDYLFSIYKMRNNNKMYKKIYYHKHKERIKASNLKRYHEKKGLELAGDYKFTRKQYIIKFD